MQKQRSFYTGLLVFSMLSVVIAGVMIQSHASPRPALRMSTPQSQMFQDLQNLSQEMDVDHTCGAQKPHRPRKFFENQPLIPFRVS